MGLYNQEGSINLSAKNAFLRPSNHLADNVCDLNKTNLNKHIVLTSASEIDVICQPLEKIDINYFSFVRSFKDGSHIRLSNNPYWTKHYYDKKFYNVILKQVPENNCNILWSSIDRYPLFSDASEHFDIDNGTVIVISYDDFVERYFFGSGKHNVHVNHLYQFSQDIFYKFIIYFKEKAADIIVSANKQRILVPKANFNEEDRAFYSSDLINEFLEAIKISKFYITVRGEDLPITAKEAKVLSCLKAGLSSKEIANVTKLSNRSIDAYKNSLKDKLSLYGTKNLIEIARKNELCDFKLL